MTGQRNKYTFQLNCDTNAIEKLIQDFLKAYNFKMKNKYGEQFYIRGIGARRDPAKAFSYNISGQTLNIYAWSYCLFYDVQVQSNYLEILVILFKEINKMNKNNQVQPEFENNEQQKIQENNSCTSHCVVEVTNKAKIKHDSIVVLLILLGNIILMFTLLMDIM